MFNKKNHLKNIAKGTMDPRHWVLWPLVQSRSFNNNLGQTSVWFCLAKGKKYIEFDKSIINFNKSITFFLVSSLNNFDKSWQRAVTEWLTRHRQCHRLTICFLFISDLTNGEMVAATPCERLQNVWPPGETTECDKSVMFWWISPPLYTNNDPSLISFDFYHSCWC